MVAGCDINDSAPRAGPHCVKEELEEKIVSSTVGLRGVVAGNSSISKVEGEIGKLVYQGITIEDLAENATFEEVCYLLWKGTLPTQSQLDEVTAGLASKRDLPVGAQDIVKSFPRDGNSMAALRTAVSVLGLFDPEAQDNSPEANYRKSIRLTARIPTIITAIHRASEGKPAIAPRDDLSLAGNFLYMLDGEEPGPAAERIFDVALTLHADHGFNASTFAARVTIATLSDIYGAVTSGIATLSGPLHGGANERVSAMLDEIGEPDQVDDYIRGKLAEKGARIMGFGHAVYKVLDPRARILRALAEDLTKEAGASKYMAMSTRIEQLMLDEKGIDCNVDFYSATVYRMLGIPVDMFTPIFAASRIAGWTAHVMEQLADNRLIRPRANYIGRMDVPYVPIEQRG